MSGSIWTGAFRPASFAGISFYVRTHKEESGRQKAINIIPFGGANIQDQGQLPRRFTVTAYLIGSGWLLAREALLKALYANTAAQTLVLPYKGPLSVQIARVTSADNEDVLGYGEVQFECIVDNNTKAPYASQDYATTLLDNIENAAASIQAEYQSVMGPLVTQATILEYATTLLGQASAAVLALPMDLISGVSTNFASSPSDNVATSTAVTTALLSAADNAVAVANPATVASTPVAGVVLAAAPGADASLGLAALTGWGASLAPAPFYPAALAEAQAAVAALVQQSAGLALVSFYSQTIFTNAQAAEAARTQLSTALETVGAAIVGAGQVDLYRAWNALSALAVQDMISRIQNLPNMASYSVNTPLPDVVLAQMLLQDGSQGDTLAQLNNAVHPLFMPIMGKYVEAQ